MKLLAILFLITSSIFCARNEGYYNFYKGIIYLFNPDGSSDETKLRVQLERWSRMMDYLGFDIETAENKEHLVGGIEGCKRTNFPMILIIPGMRNLDILKEIEGDFKTIVYTSTNDKTVLDNVARQKGIPEDKIKKIVPFSNFGREMEEFIVRALRERNRNQNYLHC